VVELDGRCLFGQRIIAEFAKPKQIDEIYFSMHPRMYIGRLNGDIKKRDILEMFGKYGDITDILMKDDFAFVEFKQADSAATAIKEMNGFQVGATRLVVEVARPKSPEERINFSHSIKNSRNQYTKVVRGSRGPER
jgi:RNA recognition motif-containing protein